MKCAERRLTVQAAASRARHPRQKQHSLLAPLDPPVTLLLNIRGAWASFLIWILFYPKCAAYQLTRLWLLNCGGLGLRVEYVCGRGCVVPWVGSAVRRTLVPSRLSSAVSTDEYSGGEAAGEKTEQNDDDNTKSQEVSEDGFHTCCSHLLQD